MLASQIEEYSRAHGFLAMRLYVIVTTPVSGHGPVQAASEEHLSYQIALERKGALFAAGPILTDDGLYCEGEGMIIIRASSLEEARETAEQDPMHRSGARRYRIRPWILNEGSLNLGIRLSDSSVIVR
jgi:uncharacterized protein